jgi:glycosyltransferase involved in cell wall biosynthesis
VWALPSIPRLAHSAWRRGGHSAPVWSGYYGQLRNRGGCGGDTYSAKPDSCGRYCAGGGWIELPDNAYQPGEVVVISQLPPPVHGSTLMTRTLLDALDTHSIPWRLIDRRFSRAIGDIGRFSPRKVAQGLGLILRLGGTVARRRPRVVVLFATTRPFSFLIDWVLSEVLRAARVPVILYLHTVGFSALAQRGCGWRHAVGRLLGSAKGIVVLGESLAWDVETFIDGRAEVIGNTLSELPPAQAVKIPLDARDTVLFLSNLVPGKGHDDFLAVAVKCLDAGVDAKFVLAGAASPSVAAEAKASIARSGWASNISYLGSVGAQDKWGLLATARAFVFPSTYANEAAPLVLLEAASCGVPIVAYPTGALAPCLAAAGAAYVVEAGNRQLLAAAVQEIFESPQLGEHLAEKAQELFAESFSYSAYAASWSRLLGRFGVQSSAQENSE